ncbi:hypothetical protein BH10BAC2_BH10BAC2_23890 [soil metagenome]
MERFNSKFLILQKLPSAILRIFFVTIIFFITKNSNAQCLDAFKYAMGTTGADAAYDIVSAGNGNFFVVGTTLENGTGKNILVTKMSTGGVILWSKIYGGLGTEVVKKASKTRDNGLLITGSTGSFTNTKGDILCMRLDNDGDLLWSKKFGLNSANGDVGMDVTETSEGGYAVAGIINVASPNADIVVIRLDVNANILWSKRFDKGQIENGVGIIEAGNSIMLTAEIQTPGADYEGIVMELQKSNGNVVRTIKLHPDTGGLNSPYISKDAANGGYWISGNLTDRKQPSKMQQVILQLDAGLNITKSYKLVLPEYTNNSFAGFQNMSNGGFIACSGMESSSSGFIFSIKNDASIVFAKKLVGGRDRKLNRVQLIDNKIIAVGSDNRQGNDEMFIIAFDSGGTTVPPCQTDTAQLTVQSHSFTSSAFSWSAISDIDFANTSATLDIGTTELNKTVLCSIDCVVKDTTGTEGCGNTWLNINNYNGGVKIGDLDIPGNILTIEGKFNRTIPYTRNRFYAGDIVSKHTDPTNANYLLRPNSAEITTNKGYFATPAICEIDTNKTYHVAMVYDGATLKFYRNGFLMSEVAASGTLIQNNLVTTIGDLAYQPGYGQEGMVGYIDEVRIWNVAKTQQEIQIYMNQSLPNPSTQNGLLAYYTFDDLKNKQGNSIWDGSVFGNASIEGNNPTCTSYIADSCDLIVIPPVIVNADFSIPDTVCVNEPLAIKNNSTGAQNFYWNFCVADINQTPVGTNLGNLGNQLSSPVFMDLAQDDNGDYYGFSINHIPGELIRYKFGSSYLNDPTVENLGNYGGAIPNQAEGLQIVKSEGTWYIVIVGGGNVLTNSSPRVVTLNFGSSLGSNNSTGLNWGNKGKLSQPIDLHVFQEGNNWYGFTVNAVNNTITRFDFSNGFDVAPTAVNLGGFGMLSYPDGIFVINDNGYWRAFVTNSTNESITRLDFGNSLLNTPTAVDLGNPNGQLYNPRDIIIIKFCGETVGFVVNANSDELIRLDFPNGLDQLPNAINLGNTGNLNVPHSLSKLFRVGSDLFSFITNVGNNSITRLKFSGCNNSSTPNSSDSTPPPITYNTPGVYNINLMVDEGLATQTSICKTIVVKDCFAPPVVTPAFIIPDTVCVNTPVNINNTTAGGTNFYWNFCSAGFNTAPQAVNLGNPGSLLNYPVYIDIVKDGSGNYFGFAVNHLTRELIRYSYGSSLNNVPVGVNLGTFSNVIPDGAQGIKIVKANSKWYAIIVGGNDRLPGVDSRIIKIEFGASLSSNAPTATNWGNIGNLDFPAELNIFQENGLWYGFTVNTPANTITRFSFGNGFDNIPTGENLGNVGELNFPSGIYTIKSGTEWYVFIVNRNNTLSRLNFGNSILSKPVGTNIGNPGNLLKQPRDISFLTSCDGITGLVVNELTNDIVQLNFGSDIRTNPAASSLGNIGNLDFPNSISEITRAGNDLVAFITNVNSSTLTKITFAGCNNSSLPNSADSIPPTITYISPGIYNINLIVDEGLPTQSSLCKIITVVASPLNTPIFDTAFCAGDSLLLTTSLPAGSYAWSNGSTDSAIAVNTPGTYWVQSDYYGCIVRDSVNTFQNALPLVYLGADTSICNTDSLLLNAGNPGAVYLWQNGSALQTLNAPDPGLYHVQVKDLNGCIGKDSITVNIYASIQVQLTNDTTICVGSTLTLSANANNAQTFTWSPSGTLSNAGINNPIASPVDTTLYTVNVSDINGCKASDSVLVNVAPLPTVAILADTVICAGDSTQLSTDATNALSYLWSPSAGLSNSNSAAPVATPASSTQYIVTVTTQYGCTKADSINITVNPLPALAAGTSDPLICIGNSTTIAATSPTAVSYNWFPSLGLTNSSNAKTLATPVNTTSYYVQATDINGCSVLDSVIVSVKAKPVFAVNPPTAGICTGETVLLTASGGDTYAWSPSATLSDPNSAITVAAPIVTTTYKAIITDNICAITDSVFTTVNITSLSTVDVTKSNDIDCILGTTLLKATGGVTYNWFPNKYLSDSTIANPVAAPLETTTYYAQVTNAGGCTGIDSVTVYVFKGSVENGYKLPSAFTPNNDGNNDCFGVRKWGTLGSLDLSIYNRWGTLVFHSNNPSNCWDGTYKGQLQPPGAYVYQIRAQALCGTVYRKGTVVLIR